MSYQPDPEKSAGNGSLVSLFLRLQEVITFPANEESATLVIVAALLSSEPEIQDGMVGRLSTKLPVYKKGDFEIIGIRLTPYCLQRNVKNVVSRARLSRASKPHQVTTMYALAVHV